MYKKDGTPISSNSMAIGKENNHFETFEVEKIRSLIGKANESHIAVVTDIFYTDDDRNHTKNQVEYEIRVEFGDRQGQIYQNVKALSLFGGNVNISETIYYPRTKSLKNNKLSDNQYMYDHDGSQVVIIFMDGYPNRPFIIGGWANTNMDHVFAASSEDGVRHIEEFNGMRLNINKDGEYILTYFGGQRNTKTKETENSDTAPTTMKFSKTGAWYIDDKENQKISIDRSSKKISITQNSNVKPDESYGEQDSSSAGELVNSLEMDKAAKKVTLKAGNDKVKQEWDGTAEKLIFTFSSGLVVTVDGAGDKLAVQTASGAKLEVDGSSGTILAQDNGTGALKISNSKVALGASSAELLQQISDTLDKIATWATTVGAVHTHATGAIPPPDNATGYIQLGTDLNIIKSLVDGIKGTL